MLSQKIGLLGRFSRTWQSHSFDLHRGDKGNSRDVTEETPPPRLQHSRLLKIDQASDVSVGISSFPHRLGVWCVVQLLGLGVRTCSKHWYLEKLKT